MHFARLIKTFIVGAACLQLQWVHSNSNQVVWDDDAVRLAQSYLPKFDHPDLDTVAGVCALSQYSEKNISGLRSTYEYYDSKFFDNNLKFSLVTQQESNRIKAAPLMIVFPGSFTNINEDQAIMWLQIFSNLGYHTLLLPNSWSLDFVKAKAKFKMGDYQKEAEIQFKIAHYVTEALRRDKLIKNDEVQIFGLSHGGFMASIVNYLFSENKLGSNVKIAQATLMSPPLNLKNSLMNLDQYINDSLVIEKSFPRTNAFYHYFKICNSKNGEEPSSKTQLWSKHIVALEGFQNDLKKTLLAYDEINNLNIIPNSRAVKNKWLKTLNYADYFKYFAQDLLADYNSPKAQTLYWVQKSEERGSNNVRILLSDDDFINQFQSPKNHHSILILRGGGHFGFSASTWFNQFMKQVF